MAIWVRTFRDLATWQKSFDLSMQIFELSKKFPKEEQYSLTDQIRRSSRSVSANMSEAWAKRRYENHWISKLTDCQAEAMETQNWLLFAEKCGYLDSVKAEALLDEYGAVVGALQKMIDQSSNWATK